METSVRPTIDGAIEALAQGTPVLLHDQTGPHFRGAIVVRADLCDDKDVNFMATHARGLICVAMPESRAAELNLPLLPERHVRTNASRFTVSIEAAEGISTGISAHDRALTIAMAVGPDTGPQDIHTPGHVFPVVTVRGGCLVKPDLVEAAADICGIAGSAPLAAFSEILNDAGDMAGPSEITALGKELGLPVVSVADIVALRRRTEKIVTPTYRTKINVPDGGSFDLHIFRNAISGVEHLAIAKGPIDDCGPVLTRIHMANVITDTLRCEGFPDSNLLARSMQAVAKAGCGVVIVIRDFSTTTLTERFMANENRATSQYGATELLNYGIPAQILAELGVRKITLLENDQDQLPNLQGFGLEIVGSRNL